jgi:hypothetical protein
MACFVERAPCFPARIFFDLLADKFTGLRGGGLPFALIAARTFDGLFLRQRANAQLTALPPTPAFRHPTRKLFAAASVHAPGSLQRALVQASALLVNAR